MKMKKIAAIILALTITSPAAMASPAKTEEPEIDYSGEYKAYEQIAEYISKLYIDEYGKEYIMEQALSEFLRDDDETLVRLLKSMLESMDDYSEFFTAEEYRQFENVISHTSYGIGVQIKETDDGLFEVVDFAEGNDNAKNAGIRIGDIISAVDGVRVQGIGMDATREMISGEEGSKVTVTVIRDGNEIDITARRGVTVNLGTVAASVYDESNIGYIRIYSFGVGTSDEFAASLDFMREKNVKNIILDLRGNGGGVMAEAITIAQQIVPKGKIVEAKFRQSKENAIYNSTLAKKEFDFAVLVDGDTASASEILASAIQDSKAGTLVGTTTFGKAVIQNIYPLQNGSILKLTSGKYITRNGREINKVGLEPDEYVENEISKFDSSKYTQFDYSVNVSLGQSHTNVRAAKERLKITGLYRGEINDIFDEEFYDTVKTFQSMNNIFSYGVLDAPTEALIESVVSEYSLINDLQFEAAYKMLGGVIGE